MRKGFKRSGFTLIELLVVIAVAIGLSLLTLGFDFQKKTASEQRTAFAEDVENLFSSTKIQSLVGKGVLLGGQIVVPDEVRVRVRTGSVAVVYYSGGTIVGTGQTLAYPFRNNPEFEIGRLRLTNRDDSVTELPAAEFDVVYSRDQISFTGASIALASAVSAEMQIGYRNAYQAVTVDKRANRVQIEDACTSGSCCRERPNYVLDSYAWNLPTLTVGSSTDAITGTADIPNGVRIATRTFTCMSDMSFSGGIVTEQPAVCDAGYVWQSATSSCAPQSCAAVDGLILDGYSWSVSELQLGSTSMNSTGVKSVSHGTRSATRTFTCSNDGTLTGNPLTEGSVACDAGYTWNATTASCDADKCAAGSYQSSGYTWAVPEQISGNISSKIESAKTTITHGTRSATRTFTCIAGTRTPGAVTLNPGLCESGYFWSTSLQACRSNACEADTTLVANGYTWNAPYQDASTVSQTLIGTRTIAGGTRSATAKISCDATGNRSLTDFSESAGVCSLGYVWSTSSSACVASSCFSKPYSQSDYVFAFPTTASGASAGVLTGTKTIANGVRTATASFSCMNATITSGAMTVNPTAVCNAGYTWNSVSGLCEGAVCAANPSYSADGYVWNVPLVPSGQTSAMVTGTKSVTHGTVYAYRTFSCDAGTFSPNALSQNPNGTCDAGYTWNLSLRQCDGIPCQANSAYTASGYSFSVPYQASGYSSPVISGRKAVSHGTSIVRASFSCEQWARATATWIVDTGVCETGYYWDGVAVTCAGVLPPGGAGTASGITVSNITGTSFSVTWQSSTGATSYEVSTNGGTTWTNVWSTTSYTATGLSPLTTYQLKLRAKNATETSSASAAIPVTTILNAPVLNAATSVGSTTFTMNWTAVSGATSYEISLNNGGVWSNVGNVTSYAVSGLTVGATYQTVVRAKYNSASSQTSNVVSVTTLNNLYTVYVLGAGGASSNGWGPAAGGAGGLTVTQLSLQNGDVVRVKVGGGGKPGGQSNRSGGGWGRSQISVNNSVAVIGAGGGGAGDSGVGGAGWGQTGGGGRPGTQSAGGSPNGSALQWGQECTNAGIGGWPNGGYGCDIPGTNACGGGGDGWYGGGTSTNSDRAGGGGSSYIRADLTALRDFRMGSANTPPSTSGLSQASELSGYGAGAPAGGTAGQNGRVIVIDPNGSVVQRFDYIGSDWVWTVGGSVTGGGCSGGSLAMTNPSNGKCYILSSGAASWQDARSACSSLGGKLASITDSQIQGFLSSNGFMWPAPWIGANDIASEGVWAWDAGDSWSYSAWNGGEPNNSGEEDCGQGGGGWNDLPCSSSRQYICQKSVNSINVISASYAPSNNNNWIGNVSAKCNGKTSCSFTPLDWGDPYGGTPKQFWLTYTCGSGNKDVYIGAEAGFTQVNLSCPTTYASCLAAKNAGNNTSGVYTITAGGSTFDTYCDMTTAGGGWTLVAVGPSAADTLNTTGAVGTLSSPSQGSFARISDAAWTALGGSMTKIEVSGVSTFYVRYGSNAWSTSQNYGCDGCNPIPDCSNDGSSWVTGRPYHVADCVGTGIGNSNNVGFRNAHDSVATRGGRAWVR